MERREFLKLAAAAAAVAPTTLSAASAQTPTTVRWWYHFDNPQNSPADLIATFEKANPGIKIQAEAIPWGGGNDYSTRMFAAVVAGNPPDCGLVKLANQARFLEMGALEPLDSYVSGWDARSDISNDIWSLTRASDGKQYYLPLQYVVIYLYYRVDLLKAANLAVPKTFDDFLTVAKALTTNNFWGFGMRGGAGGQDNWGPFVLGGGATFDKGGMLTPKALAANRWYVDLARQYKVVPPSATTDGFLQIVEAFKGGHTGMCIHHIGSANDVVAALGDKASATPVPSQPGTKGWTSFGDESNAIFAASTNKAAAFKWITFLSTNENNAAFAKLSGQLPISLSAAAKWSEQPKRFVDASVASLPESAVFPDSPHTADFLSTVWPQNMQLALLGQETPDAMMQAIDKVFNG